MQGKMKAVLLIVVFATIISAVLTSTYDDNVKSIYDQQAHSVTLNDNSSITTPAPFLSPALQVKIWGLAPIGVWVGSGLAIFLLLFNTGGKGRFRRGRR